MSESRDFAAKSPLQQLKALLVAGTDIEVTNHYITREDHPCFGTTARTVAKANSGSWYYEGQKWGNPWPKAGDVKQINASTFEQYGHPHAGDLYLTIKIVATPEMKALAEQVEEDQCNHVYPNGDVCGWSRYYHESEHAEDAPHAFVA